MKHISDQGFHSSLFLHCIPLMKCFLGRMGWFLAAVPPVASGGKPSPLCHYFAKFKWSNLQMLLQPCGESRGMMCMRRRELGIFRPSWEGGVKKAPTACFSLFMKNSWGRSDCDNSAGVGSHTSKNKRHSKMFPFFSLPVSAWNETWFHLFFTKGHLRTKKSKVSGEKNPFSVTSAKRRNPGTHIAIPASSMKDMKVWSVDHCTARCLSLRIAAADDSGWTATQWKTSVVLPL